MKKLAILLLALTMTVPLCTLVSAQAVPSFPIYEISTDDLPDLQDGTLEDWEDVLPGTSLTHDDFAPLAVEDGAGIDPADLAYRTFMAWHSATQTIWICLERVDDVYINTYAGGAPQDMWMNDGVEFMVDGDHSGGSYNSFPVEEYGEEQAKLLTGYQAQQYMLIPESPDGITRGSNTSASGWVTNLPWADGGGFAEGEAPTTSVMEGYFTAWDALNWQGPELSTRSTLEEGRIIGFQLSVMDWDVVGTYHAFHTLSGLASTWREADNFVQGELIGCDYGDCGSAPNPIDTAVLSESWGRIKASLQ
jgi:hypothetical protein